MTDHKNSTTATLIHAHDITTMQKKLKNEHNLKYYCWLLLFWLIMISGAICCVYKDVLTLLWWRICVLLVERTWESKLTLCAVGDVTVPYHQCWTSHRSAGPRPATLGEDQELFVDFSSISCLWFEIQGMRTYNTFYWVSDTEYRKTCNIRHIRFQT